MLINFLYFFAALLLIILGIAIFRNGKITQKIVIPRPYFNFEGGYLGTKAAKIFTGSLLIVLGLAALWQAIFG